MATKPQQGEREYLRLLQLAAHESEAGVDAALRTLLSEEQPLSAVAVEQLLRDGSRLRPATAVRVEAIDLRCYDTLLVAPEAAQWN